MSFFAWIILGLVAGFIGSKLVNNRGEGIVLDILLGIVGAWSAAGCSTDSAPAVSAGLIYTAFWWQ